MAVFSLSKARQAKQEVTVLVLNLNLTSGHFWKLMKLLGLRCVKKINKNKTNRHSLVHTFVYDLWIYSHMFSSVLWTGEI